MEIKNFNLSKQFETGIAWKILAEVLNFFPTSAVWRKSEKNYATSKDRLKFTVKMSKLVCDAAEWRKMQTTKQTYQMRTKTPRNLFRLVNFSLPPPPPSAQDSLCLSFLQNVKFSWNLKEWYNYGEAL